MRLLFGIVATLGLLTALGTILSRNLIHAALFLVAFFFLIACQFVMLEAEFLAAMQVLVYIGAVAILILFGILLTRNIRGDETTGGTRFGRVLGALVAVGVFLVLFTAISEEAGLGARAPWSRMRSRPAVAAATEPEPDARSLAIQDMGRAVGVEMMTRFVVPFEIAGLLLTAALVGAIALAMMEPAKETPRPGHQAGRNGHDEGPEAPEKTTRPGLAVAHASEGP